MVDFLSGNDVKKRLICQGDGEGPSILDGLGDKSVLSVTKGSLYL